jgi:RNA ligase
MKVELDQRVKDGWINATKSGNLTLYNYSNRCVFEKWWDPYTMAARGLVLDEIGCILARPWPKFFNLGERPDDKLPAETPELSKKYDGSLLIVFFDRVRWRAVTRGCWENVQTQYATKWLEQYGERLQPQYTYLFELVAPWNRIVVHYPKDDMILLGIVATDTGEDWSYAETRQEALRMGLTPVEFETRPIDSLNLEDPAIKNEEGFVARFSNGFRVKLKYRQYLYLHKIVTGLSVKGIWEILASGNQPDFSNVPDEFMGWYTKQREKIQGAFDQLKAQAIAIFQAIGKKETRKDYALEYTKHGEVAGALFRLLDGKDVADVLWKRCRPEIHEVFKVDESSEGRKP